MFLFTADPILIAAAVIPAAALLVYVYRADRLEPESPLLLLSLVFYGVAATFLALVTERIGSFLIGLFVQKESVLYYALLFFLVVGPAEEGFKYLLLKRRTWNCPAFDCQFDGVVYAVFLSLGFALWENIGYVVMYGFGTAVLRAVTAVPGHACFGVFMGVWYGIAKRYDLYGEFDRSRRARRLCVCIPALLHGCYDFIASLESEVFVLVFLAFIVAMFITALRIVKRLSARDQYM